MFTGLVEEIGAVKELKKGFFRISFKENELLRQFRNLFMNKE